MINFYDGNFTDFELQVIALGVLLILMALYLFIVWRNSGESRW